MFKILFLLLHLAAIGHASSLFERKIYDPYIACSNEPPATNFLPTGYAPATYMDSLTGRASNLMLCSAANGPRKKSLGCFCSSDGGNLHCDEGVGDDVLSKTTTPWYNADNTRLATFVEFCQMKCYCTSSALAEMARTSSQTNSQLNQIMNPNQYGVFPFHPDSTDEDRPRPVLWQNKCGTNCSSNADCSGGQNGCTCKTQSEQYVPGKGMVMFAAACIISLGGKREEQMPCPCNATYVSHACCGSNDGLVWEGDQFKLGELLRESEL